MLGVILAGGFAKRMLPQSKIQNKHLMPIYEKNAARPMIEYPIHTLRDSGIKDILIITSREHCGDIVEYLGDGSDFNINLTYKIQEMNRPVTGIAQALKLAEHFVGNEAFAVILGDNYYEGTFTNNFADFENEYKSNKVVASIFINEVNDPHRFGVATIGNNLKVTKIVEKPKEPETNFAVTGLYLYTPHVFTLLPHLKPSSRMELEVTDINNWYVENDKMKAYFLGCFWHDMGTCESILETINFIRKTQE